jgi:hypothetical protein
MTRIRSRPHFETPQYATACHCMVSRTATSSKILNKIVLKVFREGWTSHFIVGYNSTN